ncbi:MAG: SDR family oxidoreductase [Actinomycetota bacterium]|nr:SDR family oxidoreductase [Actinomycetota bacterium]
MTGALGRLGPVWTEALLDAGASVVALDRDGVRPDPGFLELQERAGPDRLCLLRGDITDRPSLEGALDACLADLGRPTVLVNNAGIDQPPQPGPTARLEAISTDDVRSVLDVNVVGTFLATQVFGAAMVDAGRGSIVNIGSIYASRSPDPRLYDHIPVDPPFLKPPAYGSSKAAVCNLTRYFAAHWGPYGVRVNTLSPGGVIGDQDPLFVQKYSARVPLGRLARLDELGGPLLFLASDASSYVNGIELKVDGGFSSW